MFLRRGTSGTLKMNGCDREIFRVLFEDVEGTRMEGSSSRGGCRKQGLRVRQGFP